MMVKQIGEIESEISQALDAHPDGEIFRSFFRSRESVICAATLLSEIGDCRARYPHRDAIAADAGQLPWQGVRQTQARHVPLGTSTRSRPASVTRGIPTGLGTRGWWKSWHCTCPACRRA